MRMFGRKKPGTSQLELISLHIPKCGGTSFRFMLKEIYGDRKVARLDIMLSKNVTQLNEKPYHSAELPQDLRVIHGHFSPEVLRAHFPIPDHIPYITWLRNPVDRVISNYYYLEHRLKDLLREEERGLNILSKMQRNLLEYAKSGKNRNRMSKFLQGLDLADFRFVGILEHFDRDAEELVQIMGWSKYNVLHYNATPNKETLVKDKIRSKIAEWNHLDMLLYEKALKLAENRRVV
jgi:hypothetical protein